MSAGSRCENVPTSRAVPHADGWPVSENGLLPGVAILPGEQMEVVDEVVRPDAARVLVEAHRPERHHLHLRVGVELGQPLELVARNARDLLGVIRVVLRDEARVLLEADRLRAAGIARVLRGLLQRVLGTQPVADVGIAQLEVDVLARRNRD